MCISRAAVTVDRVVDQSDLFSYRRPCQSRGSPSGRVEPIHPLGIRSSARRLPSGCSVGSALVPVHDQRLSRSPTCIHCCDQTFVCWSGSAGGGILDNAQYAIVRRNVQLEGSLEPNDLPDSQDPLDLVDLWTVWKEVQTPPLAVRTRSSISTCCPTTRPEVQAPEDLPASPWQWDMDSGSWRCGGVKRAVHRGRKRIPVSSTVFFGSHCSNFAGATAISIL